MRKSSMLLKAVFCFLFLVAISFTSSAMKNGVVKFYNESKGFGLVVDKETGLEMEFKTQPGVEFLIGEEVEFVMITRGDGEVMVVVEGKKGLNAPNVSYGVVASTEMTH